MIIILSDNTEKMETLFHSPLLGSSLSMPDTELGTGNATVNETHTFLRKFPIWSDTINRRNLQRKGNFEGKLWDEKLCLDHQNN